LLDVLTQLQNRLDHDGHEEPNAATPQPKRKQIFHHEDREEHEVQKYKIDESFVAFVRFVVVKQKKFLSISIETLPARG
jgi:hypothetical protein